MYMWGFFCVDESKRIRRKEREKKKKKVEKRMTYIKKWERYRKQNYRTATEKSIIIIFVFNVNCISTDGYKTPFICIYFTFIIHV